MNIELHPRSTSSSFEEPSTEIALGVLADDYRRLAVETLLGRGGPIQVADLAAAVAERSPEESSDRLEREIASRLHHAHLPKLANVDLVEDPESTTVTAMRIEPLRKYLDWRIDRLEWP